MKNLLWSRPEDLGGQFEGVVSVEVKSLELAELPDRLGYRRQQVVSEGEVLAGELPIDSGTDVNLYESVVWRLLSFPIASGTAVIWLSKERELAERLRQRRQSVAVEVEPWSPVSWPSDSGNDVSRLP